MSKFYDYFNTLTNLLLTKSSNLGASTVDCDINIEKINGTFGTNCNLIVSNSCLNNSDATKTLLLATLKEFLNNFSDDNEDKQLIMLNLGIKDLNDLPNAAFQKRCDALSSVSNLINIGEINIYNCTSLTPFNIEFINLGNANSVCGLNTILNEFSFLNEINKETYLKEVNNLQDLNYFFYLFIIAVILVLIYYIYIYLKNKKKYFYRVSQEYNNIKINNNINSFLTFLNNIKK